MNSFKRARAMEVLVFEEGGKQEYPVKTSRGKEENQQLSQSTHGFDAGI